MKPGVSAREGRGPGWRPGARSQLPTTTKVSKNPKFKRGLVECHMFVKCYYICLRRRKKHFLLRFVSWFITFKYLKFLNYDCRSHWRKYREIPYTFNPVSPNGNTLQNRNTISQQDIDVDTVKKQSNSSPMRIPPTACSQPHSLPSQQPPPVGSLLL